jgi:hypothetical protein
MSDLRLPETPAPFRAWLNSLPATEAVGAARRCGGCPVANFLKARGGTEVQVARCGYSVHALGENFPTPDWVVTFINEADKRAMDEAVTAGECLALLEGTPNA